jgi:hypothetical protein
MIKIIKQFIEYKKFIWIYQEIDNSSEIKGKLKALGDDEFMIFIEKVKNHITQKVMNEDLSKDFARWASFTLNYIKWLTK